MIPDPTEVIHEIKQELSARSNNDLHRIAEETRYRQRESRRRVVSLPPRLPLTSSTTNHMMHGSGGGTLSGDGDSTPAAP
jgi:hypothetical protein